MVAAHFQQQHEQQLEHIMNNIKKFCEKCLQELYIINFENAEDDDICKKCKPKVRKRICAECHDHFETPPSSPNRAKCPKCNDETKFLKFDNIVYVDLETSDLADNRPQILEIAALSNEGTYNRFCLPYMKINPGAAKVNGLTSKKGALYKNGNLISNIDSEENVLKEFVNWLPKVRFAFVSYNIEFDKTVLCEQLSRYGIKIDTPHRWFCAMKYVKKLEGRNISLKNAMKKNGIIFTANDLHGALYDTQCLKELFELLMTDKTFQDQSWY